jgi:hypothetical protein
MIRYPYIPPGTVMIATLVNRWCATFWRQP